MKRNLLFALIFATVCFAGCNKANDPRTPVLQDNPGTGNGIAAGGCVIPPVDCKGVLCTAHFAEVSLEVRDAAGAPVDVDSFVVTTLAGVPLPPSAWGLPVYGYLHAGDGLYTVINDGWVQGHQNSNMSVRAKGFINKIQVFDEPFVILADCCHVGKHSGKDAITITTL